MPDTSGRFSVPGLRGDIVHRPRLVDRLESSREPLTLVSAPAGSGKSVLVADWLTSTSRPAAWLSLDTMDNDPSRLSAHLGASLRASSDSSFASLAHAFDPSARPPPEIDDLTERFLEVAEGAVLVLDDVHLLVQSSALQIVEALVLAARNAPRRPRIVLATRSEPPLALARMRLEGDILDLRATDLRFNTQEIRTLLKQSIELELPAGLLARLEERTEGWAAGLRMATIGFGRHPDPEAALGAFAHGDELLVDYLVEEVVAAQEPELRRFLMETSVLPRFTAESCLAVTRQPDAPRLLRAANDADLFLVTLDAEKRWYRYHHLFAELLSSRLASEDPDRAEALRARATRWFEERGEIETALELAAQMRDRAPFLEMLDRHGYDILGRSQFATFARWLDQVPNPVPAGLPMLLVAIGWFRAQTERSPDLQGIIDSIEGAVRSPSPDYDPARLREARAQLGALRLFSLRVQDRLLEAVAMGERVLESLPSGTERVRGVVEFNLAAVLLRLGEMEPARSNFARAYESCLSTGLPYLVLASLAHLGAITAQTTGVEAARLELEGAVAFAEAEGLSRIPAFGLVLVQLARVHLLADELDRTQPLLDRASALTRGERDTDILANVLITRARVAAATGRLAQAESLLTEVAGLAYGHHVRLLDTTLEVERERLAGLRAETPRARHVGAVSRSAEAAHEAWTTDDEARFVLRLQAALHEGPAESSYRWAAKLLQGSRRRRRGVATTVALIALGVLDPDPDRRDLCLAEGIRLAAERGYIRPLLDFGPAVVTLLSEHGPQGLDAEIQEFAARVGSRDAPSRSDADEPGLTPREEETLARLASGATNQAIARGMFVSVNTVKTHLKSIFAKLGVSTRTEAVREASARGLLKGTNHSRFHPNG